MEKEIWKDIDWYKWYQISNNGLIRSINYRNTGKVKILTPTYNSQWYEIRSLYRYGVRKSFLVHRLVGMLFISNPDKKPQINHKDWNPKNNRVENLEWCTNSENMQHSFNELWRISSTPMKWKFWKDNHLSKKVKMYSVDNQYIKTWNWIREIARHFNIAPWNFSKCCLWKAKTAAWFKWEYVKY